MNQTFTCQYCKESFIPKDTHKERGHPFCSRECASLNFSAKHPRKTDKEYADKHFLIPGNREIKREADRKYSARNRERLRLKASEYFRANKATVNAKQREYAVRNKEERKMYYIAHKDRIRENHTKWCAKQRKENPMYRLHDNLTSVIASCLRSGKGRRRTEEVLGYSISDLRKHLEKRFISGMTWGNYGEWHIDHKVPLRAFNINSVDDIDFKRAWKLSNLQPLWAHDNLSKNGKIDRPFQPSLAMAI